MIEEEPRLQYRSSTFLTQALAIHNAAELIEDLKGRR
jgi:hypothetical protein